MLYCLVDPVTIRCRLRTAPLASADDEGFARTMTVLQSGENGAERRMVFCWRSTKPALAGCDR